MNEIGKILEIDPKLLGDINAIGAAIDGIANAAETTAGRYKTAFTSMVGDTDGLLGKLREVNNLLKTMGIDMTQPLSKGLNDATNAANQAAGAITQAAAAVGEFAPQSANIAQLTAQIKAMKEALTTGNGINPASAEQQIVDNLAATKQVLKEKMTSTEEAEAQIIKAQQQAAADEARINAQRMAEIQAIQKEYLQLLSAKATMDAKFNGGANTPQSDNYYLALGDQLRKVKDELNAIIAKYPQLAAASQEAFNLDKMRIYSKYSEDMYAQQEAAAKKVTATQAAELKNLEKEYLRLQKIQSDMILKGYNTAPSGSADLVAYQSLNTTMASVSSQMRQMISANKELSQSTEFIRKKNEEILSLKQRQIEATNAASAAAAKKEAADIKEQTAALRSLETEYLRLQKMRDDLNIKAQSKGSYSADEAAQIRAILQQMMAVKGEMDLIISAYDKINHSGEYELRLRQQIITFQDQQAKIIADQASRQKALADQQQAEAQRQAAEEQHKYAQLEQEVLRLNSLRQQAEKKGFDKSSNAQEVQQYRDILDLINKINAEMAQMRSTNSALVSNEEALVRAKQRELEVQREINKENEKVRNQTASGSLAYAANLGTAGGPANSYDNRKIAIQNLEAAIKSLNKADATYEQDLKRLTNAHRELVDQQKAVEREMNNMKSNINRLTDLSSVLGKAFSAAFAINYIKGFVEQLVSVRGELELQNTALASMLQSKERADALFDKVAQLSKQSPFSIKQLTTYTKQLSAYQVSYEELYGTMKRLADVSAGLGVDMQRLILAYGQVKAANYLRATEVRQFTEAGINLLGELSKYYTELEGKMVSVADVQERVTRRMVQFEDVKAIFERITDAGGLFYEMQERQAETMYGMWKNVKDRLTLMFNEMGEQYEKPIKNTIRLLGVLMSNYQTLVNVIKYVVLALVLYKAGIVSAGTETAKFATITGTFGRVKASFQSLVKAIVAGFKSISAAFMANVWLIALAAILEMISGLINHFKELNKAVDEVGKKYADHVGALEKIRAKYEEVANLTKEANESDEAFATRTYREKMKQLEELKKLLEDASLGLLGTDQNGEIKIFDIKDINAENIDDIFNVSSDVYQKAQEFGKDLGLQIVKGVNGIEGWFNIFGENLASDANDLSTSLAKLGHGAKLQLDTITNELLAEQKPVLEAYASWAEEVEDYRKQLAIGQKEGESDNEWMARRVELIRKLATYTGEYNRMSDFDVFKNYKNYTQDLKEFNYELDKVVNRMVKANGGWDTLRAEIAENPLAFKAAIDQNVNALELNEQVKQMFKDQLYLKFGIEIEPPKQADVADTLTAIQKEVDNAQKGFKVKAVETAELKNIKQYIDLANLLQKKIKGLREEEQKLLGMKGANVVAELQGVQDQIAAIEALANIFNVNLTTNKQTKSANDILKERIDLLQKMSKEYKENLKYMSKDAAQSFTIGAFKDNDIYKALEKIGVVSKDMDLSSDGLIKALEKLEKTTATAKLKKEIQTVISQLKNEEILLNLKVSVDDVKKQMDEVFDQYSMGKTLKDLGLDPKFTADMFGFDSLDLNGVQSRLDEIKAQYIKDNGELGKEQLKLFEDLQKKVDDLRVKELQSQLKTYSKYLQKEYSEAVKIKLEEAKALAEISRLEEAGLDKNVSSQMKNGVREEAKKKDQKNQWEQFQNTDMYVEMFDNLEVVSTTALENMRKKLEELQTNLNLLDPTQLKEIQSRYNQIQETLISRDGWGKAWADYKKFRDDVKKLNTTEDQEQTNLFNAETEYQNLKDVEDILGKILAKRQTGVGLAEQTITYGGIEYDTATMTNEVIGSILEDVREQQKTQMNIIETSRQNLNLYKNQRKTTQNLINTWKNIVDVFGSVKESAMKVVDTFEVIEDDSPTQIFVDMTFQLLEMAANAVMFDLQLKAATIQAEMLGVAMNAAMGPIGWILLSMQAIASITSAIVSGDRKAFENDMNRRKKEIENLQKAYETLSDTIEDTYDLANLKAYNKEARKNLELTIANAEASIALYKARKNGEKKYESEINDLNEAIADAKESLKELDENFTETLGGFGSKSNIKSAAEDFVSAWVDAFNETEDGLTGLEEQMDEFLENAVKKQLLLRLSQQYITPLLKEFDKMFAESSPGGEVMTKEELDAWKRLYKENSEAFNEKAKAYMEAIGVTGGTNKEGLDGLTKGIQGVTEDTAEVVAAITESIRFFVADTNVLLHNFELHIVAPEDMANPWYEQIKSQTNYLRQIRDSIESVLTTAGLNKVLRVQMV